MRRRAVVLGLPIAMAGCGLSERPYVDQRQWPLIVRPALPPLPPSGGGPVLEVREVRPAPGLEGRGLQTLRADGSIATAFYEQWAVPPAEGVEDSLRLWLAQTGKFAAVVGPGTRADVDVTLSGELTALWTDAPARLGRATIAVVAIDMRPPSRRILLQRTFSGAATVAETNPAAEVRAQLGALADVFGQIAAALA
jgi:ABC-type uncharacterized transport system auxiliary subunit